MRPRTLFIRARHLCARHVLRQLCENGREQISEHNAALQTLTRRALVACEQDLTHYFSQLQRHFGPCSPTPLNTKERQLMPDGKSTPQQHYHACGITEDEYDQILELVSDQTSIRTRAYHRIAISLSITVIMLYVWKVPIEQIRILGVTGANTDIPSVLLSIVILISLTLFAYLVSYWIDNGASKAKTTSAKLKLSRAAYHLGFIKKNIACGNKIANESYRNVARDPTLEAVPGRVNDLRSAAERALMAVNLVKKRNTIHRVWRWIDPIVTVSACGAAIIILITLYPSAAGGS